MLKQTETTFVNTHGFSDMKTFAIMNSFKHYKSDGGYM